MPLGEIIGERFLIEELAKSGGMGRIYKATDLQNGERVALKLLLSGDAGGAERFRYEAEILSELGHPAIVRYIDHGATPSGRLYIAMEWIEGEDLSARLSRTGLTLMESLALALRVADVLGVAHGRGVVHRDVKPSNLMLAEGAIDQVKILDFGIARMHSMTHPLTQTGIVMGTPGYMAPEFARGEREVNPRADVFSLGAVLFECLAGQPAFPGDQVAEVLAKLLLRDVPRLSELRSDIPDALDDLVARMLAKEPADRPENGAAVASEIRVLCAPRGKISSMRPKPFRALTGCEQRTVCVIVAMPPVGVRDNQASDSTLEVGLAEGLKRQIRSALSPLGAHVDSVADRTIVATVLGDNVATDQAARTARCALVMRSLLPGAPIALVTGRAETAAKPAVAHAVDRAAKLLQPVPDEARSTRRLRRIEDDDVKAGAVGTALPIYVDATTSALLDPRFDVVVGPNGSELRSEREIVFGMRMLLGRPSACVGRERVLRVMDELFDECAGEQAAHAMLVTGPAGIGKSRLRDEFIRRVRHKRPDCEVWMGRGDAMNPGKALFLIGSVLRDAAGIVTADPLAVRQHKLARCVGRHVTDSRRARVTEFLTELARAPLSDGASPALRSARENAQIMADQMRDAWTDFLASECHAHPAVLVLEDLQWGDLPSMKLVQFALAQLRDVPLVVLGVARPEVHEVFPKLWVGQSLQEIRLGELSRRDAESLVRSALGATADAQQVATIVERGAGHAFYLEELIHAAAQGCGDALPETVLAMGEGQLSALDPDARRLLRAASIFGDVFWRGGVVALLGGAMDSGGSEQLLSMLEDRDMIVHRPHSRLAGESEYSFRSPLLRHSAYAMLTESDRKLGHQLAAEWLEGAGETDPMRFAEHLERAGERAAAVARRGVEQKG